MCRLLEASIAKEVAASRTNGQPGEQQAFSNDLVAFAGFNLGHQFITPAEHASLLRRCGVAPKSPTKRSRNAPGTIDLRARHERASDIFAEYTTFAADRYKNHWERSMMPIEAQFSVLIVANTFMLIDVLASSKYHLLWLLTGTKSCEQTATETITRCMRRTKSEWRRA